MPADLDALSRDDAGDRRRDRQARGHGAPPQRHPHAARDRPEHARADVADRDGRGRHRVARARQLDRLVLDLRRRRRRAGTDLPAPPAGRVRVPPHRRAHGDLRRPRPAGRAFGVAGDAQRGVSRGATSMPSICRSPPPTSTTSRVRRRRSICGRQRDGAVQGRRVRARRRVRSGEPAHPVGEHAAPRRRAGGSAATPTSTGFLAPLESAMRLRGRAGDDSRRRRRGAIGRGGARVRGRARHDRRAPARASAVGRRADRRRRSRRGRPRPASWDLLVNATPVGTTPHVDGVAAAARLPVSRGATGLRPRLQPARDAAAARRRARRLPDASAASTCSSRRRRRNSNGGPAGVPPIA